MWDKKKQDEYNAKYYLLHTEALKAYQVKYNIEHKDIVKKRQAKCYRSRRELHAEEEREYQRRQRINYPERMRAYSVKYRARHREELRISHAKYYSEHHEKVRVYSSKYRAEHPEVYVAARSKRVHQLKTSAFDLTTAQWQERIDEFNGYCAYCLRPMKKVTQDHMTPLSRNGNHTLSNVVPCCQSCNSRKNKRTLLEYIRIYV